MTAKGLGDVTNQMAALAVGAEGATKPAEVCRSLASTERAPEPIASRTHALRASTHPTSSSAAWSVAAGLAPLPA